jgi:hypothetical protein
MTLVSHEACDACGQAHLVQMQHSQALQCPQSSHDAFTGAGVCLCSMLQ